MGGDLVKRRAVRIRDRDLRRILAAPVDPRHWGALRRMFSVYEQPGRALIRYLTNAGRYPWQPGLRTDRLAIAVLGGDRSTARRRRARAHFQWPVSPSRPSAVEDDDAAGSLEGDEARELVDQLCDSAECPRARG